MSIGVAAIDGVAGVAVDTPQDLERVRALMAVGTRA
jgi:CMP-2-keto-3-deoxyoctulosonic acid synthetase